MNRKRIFAIVLAVLTAFTATACGSGTNPGNSTQTADSNSPEETVVSSAEETDLEMQTITESAVYLPDDLTIQDIINWNYLGDLLYADKTISLVHSMLNEDRSEQAVYNYEFGYNGEGYPVVQCYCASESTGDSECVYTAGEGFAASYDRYPGYGNSITVIPTPYYTMQLEANWDMILPGSEFESVVDVSQQDGATLVVTFTYDEEYPEDYQRALYYLDGDGRIIFKEVTMYLVTEGAEVSADVPYGMDTAPILSIDTYSITYGAEPALSLATVEDLSTGDTCHLTVHIIDGDYTETQVFDVVRDALIMVMSDMPFYVYSDEAQTKMVDQVDLSGDTAEVWAVKPASDQAGGI